MAHQESLAELTEKQNKSKGSETWTKLRGSVRKSSEWHSDKKKQTFPISLQFVGS